MSRCGICTANNPGGLSAHPSRAAGHRYTPCSVSQYTASRSANSSNLARAPIPLSKNRPTQRFSKTAAKLVRHPRESWTPDDSNARSRGRFAQISLKKPSSIPLDGENSPCFGEGLEGLFRAALGPPSWRYAASISGSILIGLKRASRLRFWAVDARRNSSLAPFGPLRRRRVRRSIRLRCANSISTFFRRRQASAYSGVAACARATSRASSCRSRGILRATSLGQHCALSSQTPQSSLLAR